MRLSLRAGLLICSLAVTPVMAQDLVREDVSGLFYLSRDFGGGGRDEGVKFGFTLDHSYMPVNLLNGVVEGGRGSPEGCVPEACAPPDGGPDCPNCGAP